MKPSSHCSAIFAWGPGAVSGDSDVAGRKNTWTGSNQNQRQNQFHDQLQVLLTVEAAATAVAWAL